MRVIHDKVSFKLSYDPNSNRFVQPNKPEQFTSDFLTHINTIWQNKGKNPTSFPCDWEREPVPHIVWKMSDQQTIVHDNRDQFKISFAKPCSHGNVKIEILLPDLKIKASVNATTTGYFRFPQIYLDLLKTPPIRNQRVLILGPGLTAHELPKEILFEVPQYVEVNLVLQSRSLSNPRLFVADKEQRVLDAIDRAIYFNQALESVKDLNPLSKEYCSLVNQMLAAFAKKKKGVSKGTSALWDPTMESSPFSLMHTIIATKSITHGLFDHYFNYNQEKLFTTFESIIGALEYGGTLYLDAEYCDGKEMFCLENALNDYIKELCISLQSSLSIRVLKSPFPKRMVYSSVSEASTCDVLAITRHFPENISTKVDAYFKNYDANNYWHKLVKEKKGEAIFAKDYSKIIAKMGPDSFNTITEGWTPLHVAVLSNNPEGVKFLLKNGADPTIAAEGKTPVDFAREFYPELLELFSPK